MSKTLVACYCEPNKPALNWQLHALYLSYRDIDSDDLDFRVTVPPGTETLIDRRIPFRVAEPVAPKLRHPMLHQNGFEEYSYANHFLAVTDADKRYDRILLTDVDTLLLPRFVERRPETFLTGRGGYSTDYSHERLARFARRAGYRRFGRYRNVGATWFGEAGLVTGYAQEVLGLVPRLLHEEDWTGTEWPQWWIGVLTLYAAEIVLSERLDRLTLAEGVIDAKPTNGADERAIHLHMWHTRDWQRTFSKHAYDAGMYDRHDASLTGLAAFALKLARRGSALSTLNEWKRHSQAARRTGGAPWAHKALQYLPRTLKMWSAKRRKGNA